MSIQNEVLRGPFAGAVVVRRTTSYVINFTISWDSLLQPIISLHHKCYRALESSYWTYSFTISGGPLGLLTPQL